MNKALARKAFAWAVAVAAVTSTLPITAMLGGAGPLPTAVSASDRVFPQFGATPGHSFSPDVSGRGFNQSILKWRQPLSLSASSSIIANFSSVVALNNTTSSPDVLGVVWGYPSPILGTSLVTIAAGNNGTVMWSYPVIGNLFAAPVAADVNGDGRMDLVIRSDTGFMEAVTPNITWGGSAYTYPVINLTELQAQQIWNLSLSGSGSTNNNLSTPIAANLVGSAAPEILAPAGDRLYLVDGTAGTEIRNATVDGTIVSAPTVAPFGAGWRVFVASTNRTTTNFTAVQSDYILTAFDGSLNFLWNASFPQWYDTAPAYKSLDLQLPSPAAGELDGAGGADDVALVTPYENSIGRLRVFFNGSNTAAVNVSLQGLTGSAPAVVDLDGDGTDEVVALSYAPGTPIVSPNSAAFVEVFAGNGTRLWNATIDELPGPPRENTLAPPAIADLTGDGVKDIVVFLTDGSSEVRSGTNGSRVFRHQAFDQATPTEFSGPAVADLDKDGFLDITANAAAVSFALADLHLNASDISLNNTQPEQFEDVSVTATVHNAGNILASNVTVAFFDGPRKLNETALALILAGGTAQAQVTVNFTGGGARSLTVVADANRTVDELDEGNNTAVLQVNVTSLFGFRFESPVNRTAVQPGFSHAFILNAISEGTQENLVNLSAGALPTNWIASLAPLNLTLLPAGTLGDTNTSFFTVTTDVAASQGEYDIVVTGVSANSSRNSATITFTVIIGGQYGVSLYPSALASNVTAGDTAIYTLEVINAGNSPDTFDFANSTPPAGWTVTLTRRTSPPLPAGARTTFSVTVRSPTTALAGDNSTVLITARSQNDTLKNDSASLFTAVVVPDLVVTAVQFFRSCGGEAFFGSPQLVQGENSRIQATVANAALNAQVSSLRVRFWVEGTFADVPATIGPGGAGTVNFTFVYGATGTKTVTASVDPGNLISEASETNNDLTVQVSVKDPSPVGDFTVAGFILKQGAAVPGASVTLTNAARGTSANTTSGPGGGYTVALTAAEYRDGDALRVDATDGLDMGNATVCAYSEDVQVGADVALVPPTPYDFLLGAAGPTDATVAPGATATYTVTITNRGSLNNTVLLTTASNWSVRVIDANGSAAPAVLLPPYGSVTVRVEVTAPASGAPGETTNTTLNATTSAPPPRSRVLELRTTVGILRQLTLTEDAASGTALAGTSATVNLTVGNAGNADENVTFSASCLGPSACASWVTFDVPSLSVLQGGAGRVLATARVSPAALGGTYEINFTVAASNDSAVRARSTFNLTVIEVRHEFSVTGPSSIRLVPGEERSTALIVTNRGTVADTYTATTAQGSSGFTVRLEPGGAQVATLDIGPGSSATVTLFVGAPLEVDRESFQIDVAFQSLTSGNPNVVTIAATIGNVYDFRVHSVRLLASPEVGKEIQIQGTVTNAGSRSFSGDLPVRLLVAGEVVATQSIRNLAAGAEETVAFRWTARVAGEVNITVDVNREASSEIYESAFSNNAESVLSIVAPQQVGGILGDRGVFIFLIAIVGLLLILSVVARRKRPEEPPVDMEKAQEETDERRKGKDSGGIGRI